MNEELEGDMRSREVSFLFVIIYFVKMEDIKPCMYAVGNDPVVGVQI